MPIAIRVENLSKAYQLGVIGTGTISRDIERWWAKKRGKEDPFLKVAEVNDRTVASKSDIVWSLKDISFDIQQGDAIGIIGRNGAGKSTLLKLLSRVTAPTSGSIKVKGRIASLLEVGTGFHPELTGRENIYLNGAILGMRRKEIDHKLDEIVDFSGVEKYIDTPVKRYSSGMYVRLAFAVAAHLESEVLIVDEVLAVGDAEFQRKCLGKMKDVSTGGRTVLFVSHNMQAVKQLCNNCIFLSDGKLADMGDVTSTINNYLFVDNAVKLRKSWSDEDAPGNGVVKLLNVNLHYEDGSIPEEGNCLITKKIGVTIRYKVLKEGHSFIHGANLYNNEDINIFNSHDVTSDIRSEKRSVGTYEATMWIPGNLMSEGNFSMSIALFIPSPFEIYVYAEKIISFVIIDEMKGNSARGQYTHGFPGYVRPLLQWDARKI
jgi:lipopolysaccharide transport system ATP-binding protein